MSKETDAATEAAAREQFDYHRRRHDELCEDMVRVKREAAAHHQIMEGLALLHPSLREDYRHVSHREDEYPSPLDEPKSEQPTPELSAETRANLQRRRREVIERMNKLRESEHPQGIEGLSRVLSAHPGAFYSASDVFRMLDAEGIAPSSERVVRNTLNRAVDAGLVEKRVHPGEGAVRYGWRTRVGRALDVDMERILSGGPQPERQEGSR